MPDSIRSLVDVSNPVRYQPSGSTPPEPPALHLRGSQLSRVWIGLHPTAHPPFSAGSKGSFLTLLRASTWHGDHPASGLNVLLAFSDSLSYGSPRVNLAYAIIFNERMPPLKRLTACKRRFGTISPSSAFTIPHGTYRYRLQEVLGLQWCSKFLDSGPVLLGRLAVPDVS